MSRQASHSAWAVLEHAALLGTRRESVQIPAVSPALDALLRSLQGGDPEAVLLSSAGTLDLYEQIGRLPARVRSDRWAGAPQESDPACPPQAAVFIAQMLDGSLSKLMPEFLGELQKAGLRIPETLLPNLLAYGVKRAKLRPLILPLLGKKGRLLAAQHERWGYAAVDPNSWPSIRAAWDSASKAQRPSLVAQLRAENPAQGRALVESTWRAENDQIRLLLIKELENGLSMADEPLLETALDDRSRLVRRRAAQMLAHLPQSRLCRRMAGYMPLYLTWTPEQTRQITISLPEVTPQMRRDGIVGTNSSIAARVRSEEIIQLIGGVPLDTWTERWGVEPRVILRAILTTAWPRTLTSGFASAALRQNNSLWARTLIDESALTPATKKLIPILQERDFKAFALRALSDISGVEISKESSLPALLRNWPGPWEMELASRMVAIFAAHFRATADLKTPNYFLREVFLILGRTANPDLIDVAVQELSEPEKLGPWRKPAIEFLRTLRFRRDMLAALYKTSKAYGNEVNLTRSSKTLDIWEIENL
jgi:hypothetical protein